MRMKKLIYQVYVGKRSKLYDHCTASVKAYADRVGADYVLQRAPILMIKPDPFTTMRSREAVERLGYLPIFEKENALAYLKTYDQVVIVDSDIYIREDAPSIFDVVDPDVDFAGVLERDMPITPQYTRKLANYTRMQYGMRPLNKLFDWNCPKGTGADFYNMGMMFLNKSFDKYLNGETPKQFLRRPEFKAFIDGIGPWKWSTDQTLLNVFVKESKMKVQNLDHVWNGLFTANEKIKECHFVHFFLKDKLPARGENVPQLMAAVNG